MMERCGATETALDVLSLQFMMFCFLYYVVNFCLFLSLRNIRRTPNQLHSQQRIPTQHDMLPQQHVYRNELNCKCYNITLARRNIVS